MDTASCSYRSDNSPTSGYGADKPHAGPSLYHDRESCVAAIAATFGATAANPAPASPSVLPQSEDLPGWALIRRVEEAVGIGRAAGDTGCLDLMEGHKSSGKRVLLKTEVYPSGASRTVVKEVDVEQLAPVAVAGKPKRLKREKSEQERVDSSVARTRKVIRQRCMAFKCDRLLTLTYRENVTDRERAYRDTARFIQRCKQVNLLPKYVAVPEQQKRGAWHVHIACRGFMSVITLRRLWREVVGQYEGKPNGNIDMSYRHRGQLNPWRIAAYLSKYIGKAVEQSEAGDRTFWASEWGGQEPWARVSLLPEGVTLTQVAGVVGVVMEEQRVGGMVSGFESWFPRSRSGDPPGVFVFWAA